MPDIHDATAAAFTNSSSPSVSARTEATEGAPIFLVLATTVRTTLDDVSAVPSGFTLVHHENNPGSSSNPTVLVYRKTSSGSESGTYAFTLSGNRIGSIGTFWVSGTDETTPVPTGGAAGDNNGSGSSTTGTAPSVTTERGGCLILRAFSMTSTATTLDLTGLTTLWNAELVGGVGYSELPTAGAAGTYEASWSSTRRWAAVTVAIQPPSGTPGTISDTVEIYGVGTATSGTMYAKGGTTVTEGSASVQTDGSFALTGLDPGGTYRVWGEVSVDEDIYTSQVQIRQAST